MNTYTLKNLSEFSGLEKQMIILWNKKFKLFSEEKIDKSSFFNQEHVQKLIIVSFLIESNKKHTVEKLSSKTIVELKVLSEFEIHSFIQKNNNYHALIELMICSCFSYDSRFFDSILSVCFSKIGIEKCCVDIVFPFLSRMSVIIEKYIIQDSVISFSQNLVRKHLFYLIKSIPYAETNNRTWLLFLPENELHDLELLYAHLLLKIYSEKALYMGDNFNLQSVKECLENVEITHVFTYIDKKYDKEVLANYLILIKKIYPNATIFVATYQALEEKITEEVPYINVNNPTVFNAYLQKIMTM